MIDGASDAWKALSWRQELRNILEAALRGENPDAARDAEAIINLLVARGETEHRTPSALQVRPPRPGQQSTSAFAVVRTSKQR